MSFDSALVFSLCSGFPAICGGLAGRNCRNPHGTIRVSTVGFWGLCIVGICVGVGEAWPEKASFFRATSQSFPLRVGLHFSSLFCFPSISSLKQGRYLPLQIPFPQILNLIFLYF